MLENVKTISKYTDSYKVVSIIGLSKNAGKTTVLNRLIEEEKTKTLAITSIGLDGEKIDNVNFKPKPRIKVYKGMLIATAYDCLEEAELKYVIHEITNINTSLGAICIIEAQTDGFVLVAGPSTKSKMKQLIKLLKKYDPYRIYLDGALFRKSFSVQGVVEAMILVAGASYAKDMYKTIYDTILLIDQLSVARCEENKNTTLIDQDNKSYYIQKEFSKDNLFTIINDNQVKVKYLRLYGAITNKIVDKIIELRDQFQNATIQIDDSISFVCDLKQYQKLKKINISFCVEHTVPVLFLGVNPFAPTGYEYEKDLFKSELQSKTSLDCINVLTDLE